MTIENINNNERKYLLQIFRARLDKSKNKLCACNSPMAETYRVKGYKKLLYCKICLRTQSPIVNTVLSNTKLQLSQFLKITAEVLSKGDDLVPKAIWHDQNIAIPSTYRAIKKIRSWEDNTLKKLHKKPIKRIDRTERDVLRLILKTVPPFKNENK
jgi:hypothetical protein